MEKLCIGQLNELNCSTHIIWVIKSRMREDTCGTYWRKDKCSQDFGKEILKERRSRLQALILLKWIFHK